MNLFMVLLSVLATLSLTIAATSMSGFAERLVPERNRDTALGLARSWWSVQHIHTRLVLRDSAVYRLKLDAFIDHFALGEPMFPDVPGLDQSGLITRDPDLTAYRVEFLLANDTFPLSLTAWRVDAADFLPGAEVPVPLVHELTHAEAFDLFVYPGHEKLAWDIAAYLSAEHKRFDFLFMPNRAIFGFVRQSGNFTFEVIYK